MDIPYTVTARPDTGLYNGKLGIWLFLASEVMLFGALFTAYLFMRLGAEDGTWPAHVLSVPLGLTNTAILIISSITMVYAWVALKERQFNKYRIFLGITILCGLVFLSIKGIEYKMKWDHWGFKIKEDAIATYMPELQKRDIEVIYIPTQHVYQVSGDRDWEKEKSTPDSYVFEPVKTFHPVGYKPAETSAQAQGTEDETFTIARKDVDYAGNFLPAYGTYFAIYFTVTGLHALHIIGGVVVMLYFLTIGSGLYKRNPEQLSNRIEVTGIFWHFVDLVWITVFPILYLT
ncbi:MAG: cytochrome c oxidase subunit 3 [Methylacidiphilales bacterium]|nr:cytochrome c oxidase subunit 3 [Candidatus Methylacidiphilales bacterium]